ncbi:MAG TPA: hypothetical protein VGG09_00400 [Acidimicrobiales bacterium]
MELKVDPTPIQVAVFGQESEFTAAPNGIVVGGFQAGGLIQGLLLLRAVAIPPNESPEATQFIVLAQETEVSEETDG